ncbi:hypothetical protein [Paraburkholderia aromaticivorans]|uniref:hypothetical protein n=1 Tax=Paraburkholderia aromaticivorans TaxID=2026199 RepID=UPI0014562035|nr:hypothetical protein [Paraburkholderia aromaticivorans]
MPHRASLQEDAERKRKRKKTNYRATNCLDSIGALKKRRKIRVYFLMAIEPVRQRATLPTPRFRAHIIPIARHCIVQLCRPTARNGISWRSSGGEPRITRAMSSDGQRNHGR